MEKKRARKQTTYSQNVQFEGKIFRSSVLRYICSRQRNWTVLESLDYVQMKQLRG